ncbi:MAG TPA: dioxygenase [Microbacterium sp.]|uniref:dioxygenase family protein n=1 Tax=Microbacterium sp. TaxID=51671 RepID=UPI002C8A22C6|nr:dioxygenase [Microbacterium sp.]HWI31477.1 dioxygenase [Microbacterium sp.]
MSTRGLASDLPIGEQVAESFDDAPEPLRSKLRIITKHLHAMIDELNPTIEDWNAAIEFLTRTGHMCNDVRQEFVLLSDVFGVSSKVETINHSDIEAATESTVLGPFHMTASPARELGDSIDELGKPDHVLVRGRVVSTTGEPVPRAQVDIWQADESGFYDVQVPDIQPAGNGRGLFRTDDAGRFWFRTVIPSHYPIPTDGPVGEMLLATGRHPYRPAHIHFIADADGYETLTTHIFVAGSPYLDSDAVFAVKPSLIRSFDDCDDPSEAERYGLQNPFKVAEFDLVLAPQNDD